MELMEKVIIETDQILVESDEATVESTNHGYCIEFKIVAYTSKVTHKEVGTMMKTPELYLENLETLQEVMTRLPDLISIDGLHDLEIRVKVDDVDSWAVIAYGESGDPAIVRFDAT